MNADSSPLDRMNAAAQKRFDAHVDSAIAELVAHMRDKGEQTHRAASSMGGLMYEKKAELVQKAGSPDLVLVTAAEDWVHDALDGARIFHGTVYAEDEPFAADTTSIDGYFEDEDTGRWIHLSAGSARDDGGAWRQSLDEFPEVMAQYDSCMEDSEFRHLAEKSLMINMARGVSYDD